MVFKKIFLFNWIEVSHGFKLAEVRPAVRVYMRQLKVTTGGENRTDGNVHQILFLFLCKFFPDVTEFLYANQKQNTFRIWFFSEALHELFFQLPPAHLEVVIKMHAQR